MVQQVLQHFGFTWSSAQATPLATGHSLSAPPSDESVEPSGPYPELVGCLMYLMTCTCPDLAYPLGLLARYVAPGRHRKATQRSSQGYTFSLGSGLVSWRSTRSSSVLGSSCEAEIYATAMAAQELRWLTYLLTDLGERPRSPPVLYVDNKAAIALCQEHRLEHITKHIALRYFLARELQQCGQLRLTYVATRANTADIFTKALLPTRVRGQGHERYFLLVVDDYSRYTTVFPLRSKGEVTEYAPHQLNLQPRVSLPEKSPTLLWTGKVGDASAFRDVSFDELVPYYRLFPYRTASLPPPPLFLAPGPLPVDPLPPQGPAPSGVSQVDAVEPVEVAVDSGAATGAEPAGAGSGGAESGGAENEGAEPGGAEPGGAEPEGAEPWGAEPGGTEPGGAERGGAGSARVASRGASPRREVLSPQELREWFARRWSRAAGAGGTTAATSSGGTCLGGAGAAGPGGPAEAAGVGPTGVSAGASGGTDAAGSAGTGAAGATGVGAAGGVGAGATADAGPSEGAGAGGVGARGAAGAGAAAERTGAVPTGSGECPQPVQSQSPLQPVSPLPAPSPYTGPTGGLAERRTHQMTLSPSTAPLRVPLPSPPASSLPSLADPESDSLRAACPTVARFLATVVIDPSLVSTAASALVAELVVFAARCRLDYAASLVVESASVCPPSVEGECALGTDVLEDRQEEFQCFAAALPHLVSTLLAPEGDPDAPDIPTPRSYAEAIEGPYSSQWQAAMDAEMASWKSTGTYVDEVPPPGANIPPRPLGLSAPATAAAATAAPACCATMASLRVLALDHEGRLVQFDTWLDDLQLYLLSDSKDIVSLSELASGAASAPPTTADSATRSQTTQALYDAVVTRNSLPATAALGRLLLPYLFPELSAFATVEDLISHLRTSDARYRATVPAEFLERNQPPMFITLNFIVTRLPDSLRSVRDHFLYLDPTSLTVDLLEQHLLAAETSTVAVGAACGTPRPPFFEGCSPSPLAPSYASAAADADVSIAEDVGAASASAKCHSNKGKGGRGGGGGSGGGGGGTGSGGGGSSGGSGGSGGGGGGGTGGGSGGSGGGGRGSGGSGGTGGGGTGGSRTGPAIAAAASERDPVAPAAS
ncbi:unnamed protein product [Closterium sp. NIES-54]